MSGSKYRTCQMCKRLYFGYPAISRVDNKTEICPDCGTKEAMIAMMESDAFKQMIKSKEESGACSNCVPCDTCGYGPKNFAKHACRICPAIPKNKNRR